MKKNLPVACVIVMLGLVLLIPRASKGSHSMGADLTYECLGGNTYRVTLAFYRDCIGVAAPNNATVTINSPSCGQNLTVTCYRRSGTGQEVTPSCSTSVTTCQGGSFTGIQEYIYDGIVTLPAQCPDWTFAYSLCCRNAAITTINNPSSNTFFIYATLNNQISPCNSSPTFSNRPVPFVCLGQQYCFNHGAFDIDGDSLTYQLITPRQSAGSTVNYQSPYSASNPLNSSPATTFNPVTGDICINPQSLEVTVMAVLVREYRNGVLIGSVERDMQLTVMTCSNNIPTLTGIDGTNNFTIDACANQPLCFDVISSDPDAGQTLSVSWNGGIPGATFTTSSGSTPTGTFCWTPPTSAIGSGYQFTVSVADDACPYSGSQTFSYTVNVNGLEANAGPDQVINCSNNATLTATASGSTGPFTYLWNTGETSPTISVGTGTYWVTISDGECSATDTVNVTVSSVINAAFAPAASCANIPVMFDDQSTSNATLTSWSWDFGNGATSNVQNPVYQYPTSGTYQVTLIVTNNVGCADTVTQPLTILQVPNAAFTAPSACFNTPTVFTDQSGGNPVSWSWNFGNGSQSSSQNPSRTYAAPGTYQVTLIVTDANGCSDTVVQNTTVHSLPVANAGTDQSTCAGTPVVITASGGTSYQWMPGGMSGSSQTVTPSGSTQYVVTVTDANGCTGSDTVQVIVNPLPNINAGADASVCSGNPVTLTATGAPLLVWNPGNHTGSSFTVSPLSQTTYTVTGTGANGCTSTDAVTVNVNANPVITASNDTAICVGQNVTLSASGSGTFSWSPGGSTSSSVIVSPSTSTAYSVTLTNGNGCTASEVVFVQVRPLPVVSLQSLFICAGASATLDAGNDGIGYLWNTGDTTRQLTVNTSGVYSVAVTNAFGCSASSNCTVTSGTVMNINLADVSFCFGDTIVLNAGNPGASYAWTPGGQTTQSIQVSQAGFYGVTVTDSLGCSGSVTVSATVNPLPVADFSSTQVCQGSATSFTDASSIGIGNISAWTWDFGGSQSNQQNPTYTFGSAGTYPVTLEVTTTNGCRSLITHPVTVNPLPQVDFSMADACQGSPVTFMNQSTVSTGNITSWQWSFGDGGSTGTEHSFHTYTAAGPYQVVLQATTAGGCSASLSKPVDIHPLPSASFIAPAVCVGNATSFTNFSIIPTGSIASYNWDFGNSFTSGGTSPSHTYAVPGNYQVTLTATSSFGCTASDIQTVTVHGLPPVNAGADPSTCAGTPTVLSASGAQFYVWSPNNIQSPSIVVNPASNTTYTVIGTDANGCTASDAVTVNILPLPHAQAGPDVEICTGTTAILSGSGGVMYDWSPGGFSTPTIAVMPSSTSSYILTVTDASGCIDKDTVRVTVRPLPNVNAGADRVICEGSTISITAVGASTYSWNPGGQTTQSIFATPATNSSYVVTGTNIYGCSSTDTVHVTLNPVPVVTLYPTFVCAGSNAILDAGNPGATYSWSTGQTTQTLNVSNAGTYAVIVTNSFGCATFASSVVTVGGTISTTPTTTSTCSGQPATLNAGNPGSTYLWSTGATTQTISPTSAGNYYVTVTDVNGCSATIMHTVNVNPLPVAQFNAANVCLGSPAVFQNTSSISAGGLQSFVWNFGNGMTSNLQHPVHNYTSSGTYQPVLTVTSTQGCVSTYSAPVTIHPRPVPAFSSTISCANTPVSFTDQSSVSGGSILSWAWTFGDGQVSSQVSPAHQYSNSGTYLATLTVTSGQGCTASISNSVSVRSIPNASFTAPAQCAASQVLFTNTTSSAQPVASNYWSFSNGSTSVLQHPASTYFTPGTYPVTLIVTDVNGCMDTAIQQVTIHPLPVSNFATADACVNSPVQFTNMSTVPSGSISASLWNFGNATTSGQFNATSTYGTQGTYNVSLITVSDLGCRDTIQKQINIHPRPQPSFAAPDVCVNAPMQLANTSVITGGSFAGWQWDFSDNTASQLQDPVHIYFNPGTYQVTLTATSSFGCTASYSSSVNIHPEPVVSFTAAEVCSGHPIQFINHSSVAGGTNYTSAWNFGDGNNSAMTSPSHLYQSAGNYPVTLVVTSQHGCVAQSNGIAAVHSPPMVRFATQDNCIGMPTSFTDQSYALQGTISSWEWNFGDGSGSTTRNPVHQYVQDGQYPVQLTATTTLGCSDNELDSVKIFPRPQNEIQAMNACEGDQVQFSFISHAPDVTVAVYEWDMGNGSLFNQPGFAYAYNTSGVFNVTLTSTSTDGCRFTDLHQLTVYPKPQPAFTAAEACLNSPVQFMNTSTIASGSSHYQWTFGDLQSSTQASPSHMYAYAGNYNVQLTAVSDKGCQATHMSQVRVNPNPVPNFTSNAEGCIPLRATFFENSTIASGAISGWLWNFGDGNVSTDRHPDFTYHMAGIFDVTLSVVSDKGCTSTLTRPGLIRVYPEPEAMITADPPVVDILNPVINFRNLSTGFDSYQWVFSDGYTTSSEFHPVHAFRDTGHYTAYLLTMNGHGCVDTAVLDVYVKPYSTLYVPNCFTPNGDGFNDYFTTYHTQMKDIQVWIYDRWGKLLVSWDDVDGKWDGSYNGELCQQDTYVYKIKGMGADGKYSEWVGHVSIVY